MSGACRKLLTYDPFGAPDQPPPSNTLSERWTARWHKKLDTTSSLILMGARPYDPSLGRFLAIDPVEGGSLNSYDYAGQDPVNDYDLDGRLCGICLARRVNEITRDMKRGAKVVVGGALFAGGAVMVKYHGKKHLINCMKSVKKTPGLTGIALALVGCPALVVTPATVGATFMGLGGCIAYEGATGERCKKKRGPTPNWSRVRPG